MQCSSVHNRFQGCVWRVCTVANEGGEQSDCKSMALRLLVVTVSSRLWVEEDEVSCGLIVA